MSNTESWYHTAQDRGFARIARCSLPFIQYLSYLHQRRPRLYFIVGILSRADASHPNDRQLTVSRQTVKVVDGLCRQLLEWRAAQPACFSRVPRAEGWWPSDRCVADNQAVDASLEGHGSDVLLLLLRQIRSHLDEQRHPPTAHIRRESSRVAAWTLQLPLHGLDQRLEGALPLQGSQPRGVGARDVDHQVV